MTAHDRPITPNIRGRYRVGVLCHSWRCNGQPRTFWYDGGHWVCDVCGFVETDREGNIAPSPWISEKDVG